VVSLERLNQVGSVDVDLGCINVGAGATLSTIQAAAASNGWMFGVDLASRESASVGGMIATNAGGLRVVQHGQMRQQIVSLEAVLADGTILLGTQDAPKDNAGYDLAQLLIGSEGTLGIVTSARLRLVPPDRNAMVALVGVRELAVAIRLIGKLRRAECTLAAAEFFDDAAIELVCQHTGAARPIAEMPWYVVIECVGDQDLIGVVSDVFSEFSGIQDDLVVIGSDTASARRLWNYRERITESIARVGVAHKLDVGIPRFKLDSFAAKVRASISGFDSASVTLFGHLNEGNVHVNVLGVDRHDEKIDDAVLRLVAEFGGNVAAEHGVGRAKSAWLHLSRTPEELRTMRAIKFAFDPKGILNPGAVLV
jgi:FAD/FMN-containing dehydrogenase